MGAFAPIDSHHIPPSDTHSTAQAHQPPPLARSRRAYMVAAAAAFASPTRLLTRLLPFFASPSPLPTTTTTCLHMSTTPTPPPSIRVLGAGTLEVNGLYAPQDPSRVPAGFQRTCEKMRWPPQATVRSCVLGVGLRVGVGLVEGKGTVGGWAVDRWVLLTDKPTSYQHDVVVLGADTAVSIDRLTPLTD